MIAWISGISLLVAFVIDCWILLRNRTPGRFVPPQERRRNALLATLAISGVPIYLWLGIDGLYVSMMVLFGAQVVVIWWAVCHPIGAMTRPSVRRILAASAPPFAFGCMFGAFLTRGQTDPYPLFLSGALLFLVTGLVFYRELEAEGRSPSP